MKKDLVINAGSSTLKWKLFSIPDEAVIATGLIDPDQSSQLCFYG